MPRLPPKENESLKRVPDLYSTLPLYGHANAIRVLDLSPGLWSDKLFGTLRAVALSSKPIYEALSYTWGASVESKSICVNKLYDIGVTDNLYRALRRLRGRVGKRSLWIDAICINQCDNEEQGQQVSIMGSIYKNATTVLVWLGEYPDAKMSDPFQMRRPHWKRTRSSMVLNSRGRSFVAAFDSAIRNSEPKWHDRAWVVQEFVLAKETLLCFGPVSVAYDAGRIIDLLTTPQTSPKIPMTNVRAFHEKTSDMKILKYGLGETKQSIAHAALYTSIAACKNPQDKVFGLLSLIDEKEARLVEVNYKDTYAQTYAKATYACIIAQESFTILELITFIQSSDLVLPSWVVDFTKEQYPSEGRIHQFIHKNVSWTKEPRSVKHAVNTDLTMKVLNARGVRLDCVAAFVNIPATNSIQPGDKLAGVLAPFLQVVLDDLIPGSTIVACRRQSTPLIRPSLLLVHGRKDVVTTVLNTAFVLWNDITGFSGQSRGHEAGLFWDCDQVERQRRAHDVDFRVGWFMEYALFAGGGCTVFATTDGLIGLAPATIEVGDSIVLLHGSKLPLVLRPSKDEYNFRGFAYVHGILDGELIRAWQSQDIQEQEFRIC